MRFQKQRLTADKDLRCGPSLDRVFTDESVKRISFPGVSLVHGSPCTFGHIVQRPNQALKGCLFNRIQCPRNESQESPNLQKIHCSFTMTSGEAVVLRDG